MPLIIILERIETSNIEMYIGFFLFPDRPDEGWDFKYILLE